MSTWHTVSAASPSWWRSFPRRFCCVCVWQIWCCKDSDLWPWFVVFSSPGSASEVSSPNLSTSYLMCASLYTQSCPLLLVYWSFAVRIAATVLLSVAIHLARVLFATGLLRHSPVIFSMFRGLHVFSLAALNLVMRWIDISLAHERNQFVLQLP